MFDVDNKLPSKPSNRTVNTLAALLPRDKRARQGVFALAAVVGLLQVNDTN
jgi:hypothetical protein